MPNTSRGRLACLPTALMIRLFAQQLAAGRALEDAALLRRVERIGFTPNSRSCAASAHARIDILDMNIAGHAQSDWRMVQEMATHSAFTAHLIADGLRALGGHGDHGDLDVVHCLMNACRLDRLLQHFLTSLLLPSRAGVVVKSKPLRENLRGEQSRDSVLQHAQDRQLPSDNHLPLAICHLQNLLQHCACKWLIW